MNEKILKRGYYFPEKLLKAWEKFHLPSKTFGSSPAGAFLLWLALEDLPGIREKAAKLSSSPNISKARNVLKKALVDELVNAEIQKELDDLGPAKEEFLRLLKQAKEQASRDS